MAPRWTKEEREELERLTGDLPWRKVVRTYRRWATENGYPRRTDYSIRAMAEDVAGSRIAYGTWLRLSRLMAITGVTAPTAHRWIGTGALPVHLEGGRGRGIYYVNRSALRAFAKANPKYFAGLEEEALAELFDPGSPLVEQFAAMPRKHLLGRPRPVICLDTGRHFSSAAEAAKAHYVTPAALRSSIYKGTRSAGRKFRYADAA